MIQMYDTTLEPVKEKVEMYGFETLVPASNTLVIVELTDNPSIKRWVSNHVQDEETLEMTWEDENARITVSNQ